MEDFQKSKGSDMSHQGLILIVFKHIAVHMGVSEMFNWVAPKGISSMGFWRVNMLQV